MNKKLILASMLLVVGCKHYYHPIKGEPYVNNNNITSEVNQELSQSAESASRAMAVLAQENNEGHPPDPHTIDTSKLPPALKQNITVMWSGPAQELVRKMARDMGYDYVEMGPNTNLVNLLVSLDVKDEPTVMVFEDITRQLNGYGMVNVNVNTRTVVFRKTDGTPPATPKIPYTRSKWRPRPVDPIINHHAKIPTKEITLKR